MTARLDGRRNDASDATPEILQQQLRHDPGLIDWFRVDVGTDRDTSFAAVRQALGLT
jgi:predicted kinase